MQMKSTGGFKVEICWWILSSSANFNASYDNKQTQESFNITLFLNVFVPDYLQFNWLKNKIPFFKTIK